MKKIRCSGEGCNKSFKGADFDQIAKDNNLKKAGIFYYCEKCAGVFAVYKAKKLSKEALAAKKNNAQEITNDK